MKVSTRGRYALRLMIDIALNSGGKPVRIKEIAQRQMISEKYLEQIVAVLHKGGLVRSSRGPQGGYYLTRDIGEYTAGSILTLIEGSLAPVACLGKEENDCPRQGCCSTLRLWEMVDGAVQEVVNAVTLADLVRWQQELGIEKKRSVS